MKALSVFFLLLTLVTFSSCDTETPEKAGIYHDAIVSKINLLTGTYESKMSNAIDDFVPEEMNSAYSNMEKYISDLETEFGELNDFYGDDDLLSRANTVIKDYKKALPLYAELIKNESTAQDEYTDKNEQKFNDLTNEINTLLNKSINAFQKATYDFGAKHKITIEAKK